MTVLSEIEQREKGAADISIGTSLGIQAACGLDEEGKVKRDPPIDRYDELLINIRTLFRNLYSLFDKSLKLRVEPDDLVTVLMSEIRVIEGMVARYGKSNIRVSYYACDYKSLERHYPYARIRGLSTDLQKMYATVENRTIELLHEAMRVEGMRPRHYDTVIEGGAKNTLIVTHYAVDLLSRPQFGNLDLLETHTGAIKRQAQWNTKLSGKKDELTRIPFNKMTLQLFSDSSGMFSPFPKKIRDELVAIAEKNKWNSITTKDRILLSVKLHRDFTLEKLVRELYR